jgi:peptide/nickel transport system permease protein
MRRWSIKRQVAFGILLIIFCLSMSADFFTHSYAEQNRETIGAPPSDKFPLGTDDLGRDRLARLLHGSRVSLLLAPAAALLSIILATLVGTLAGYCGGIPERLLTRVIDIFLSLPWLFFMLIVRSLLPLNTPPRISVLITFALLGCVGWAWSARIIHAAVKSMRHSGFMLQARATGVGSGRLLRRQLVPNLKPLVVAQFWYCVPIFIISEANLALLGLGVAEPLPSWGGLLRELETCARLECAGTSAASVFAPVVLLALVVSCFHIVLSKEDITT